MPSKSKSQQRLFGMVNAYKSGDLDTSSLPDDLSDKVRDLAQTVSKKTARDFAKTKTRGKPEHVAETMTFKAFLDKFNDE